MAQSIIVILGQTASGKSALGIRLAKRFHGVIISADSRQVYRGMDLGTGKVTKKEMSGVPHYLLDVASPRTQYSVAHFARDVARVMKRISLRTPIFLVGGSPFYIKAVTEPGSFSPVPPDPVLRRRLARRTLAQLQQTLKQIDPTRYRTIDRANRRRLIRAIETARSTHTPASIDMPSMHVLKIGINIPRPELLMRIDKRVDERLRRGMMAEVARLHHQGISWPRLDAFGLEYRFLSRFVRGKIDRVTAVAQLKSAIHDFAKRQKTWWKRDQDIRWIKRPVAAERLVRAFLEAEGLL